MRLYRGLKTRYRPERVGTGALSGTDFTDCPFTALRYASTSRGEVLVLDVPPGAPVRITEELWLGQSAKRLMVWGRFDHVLARIFLAKELRARVRVQGVAGKCDEYKSRVLTRYIDRLLPEGRSSAREVRSAAR